MPRTKDTVQLNFDIPPAIAAKLKAAAKIAGLSLREFIEKLLNYYLAGGRLKKCRAKGRKK